jgi:hypothetical protein
MGWQRIFTEWEIVIGRIRLEIDRHGEISYGKPYDDVYTSVMIKIITLVLLIRTVVPRFTPTKRECKNSRTGDDHDGYDNNSDNNNNNNIYDMSVWYWPLLTLATEGVCACLDRSGFQHFLQLNKTSWMQIPRYLSPFMVYPTSRTCRTATHPQRVLASNTRLSTSRSPLLMRGLFARRPAGFWGGGFCFASPSPECSYDVNWQCVQHKFIHFPTVT